MLRYKQGVSSTTCNHLDYTLFEVCHLSLALQSNHETQFLICAYMFEPNPTPRG